MIMNTQFGSVFLIALLAGATPMLAKDFGFAKVHEAGATRLELKSEAVYRFGMIFKICEAGLYLPSGVAARDCLAGGPVRLELAYHRSLSREQIVEAGTKILRRCTTDEEWERWQPQVDLMNSWFEDVEKGDRYALTFVPGIGIELERNGDPVGLVEGDGFGPVYLRIWLGEGTTMDSLRDQLLNE